MTSLEVASSSSERGEVVLLSRESEDDPVPVLELRVNGVFVMDTRETSTERDLARAALSRVTRPRSVLVGGLGLGFTAQEVLADPRVEELTVVEVETSLVAWMRDGTVPHGPQLLGEPRIRTIEADLRQAVLETPDAAHDLVLLDIDNGPDQLVHESNAEVYEEPFLLALQRILLPDGVLAVWSAHAAPVLATRLGAVCQHVATVVHDVRLQGRVEQYWLYIATR